jgi:hypothetical protein
MFAAWVIFILVQSYALISFYRSAHRCETEFYEHVMKDMAFLEEVKSRLSLW